MLKEESHRGISYSPFYKKEKNISKVLADV